ncbi:unnamed protein product [Enterobius vermicularis]|uniref:SGF29 C-terminal domain-containing protein n=1 Tax=Enterobius vermicularis TaxID=51028 RepID=A0A0N4VDQ8_ENTVE|nr:unnamed protein product [Enterobius vermicularis]
MIALKRYIYLESLSLFVCTITPFFLLHDKVYEAKRASSLKRGELMELLVQRARFTPLWVSKPDEFPPPLVGAIPASDSEALRIGWDVAAFVNNIWMLAEVVGVSASSGSYEVRDLDDEQKDKKYSVRRSRMIPLPHWRADPQRDSHALFPVNAIVLALYPQTTCFYKGVIERVPETANDGYMVAFEDAQFPQGYSPPLPIPQRYVVVHKVPRPYKKKRKNEY